MPVLWLCEGNDNPHRMDYQRYKHLLTILSYTQNMLGLQASVPDETGEYDVKLA
jgi:hypothetical protein